MHKIYIYIYIYILRYQLWSEQNQNRVTVTDAFLSHAMRKKLCKASKKKGRRKKKLWWGWGYALSCLDRINVWLIFYYFWYFSVCIYDDLALDYASGSSKNDVTMMEQVSIVKRAKFIVRTKRTIPYQYIKWIFRL